MGPRALSILGLSLFALSCTVEPIDLAGRECPCIAGWVCDDVLDQCVPLPDGASPMRDGGVRRDGGPSRDGGPARDGGMPGVDGGPPPPTDGGPKCMPTTEVCNGADDDCDGDTDEDGVCAYDSCANALASGETSNGVYQIDPDGTAVDVYCDLTTDGGGWTLVGSTLTTPLADQASSYYGDLATLAPGSANRGVWDGLRGLSGAFDVRFACRASPGAADAAFDVDLSMYDVNWYLEWTTGTDAECCFSELDGMGDDDPPPARRNNIDGSFRDVGDLWDAAGFLEGEDTCPDDTDFTVDFDNRGMDDNQGDGTDWGEDDSLRKCGADDLPDGQWFIFVRER